MNQEQATRDELLALVDFLVEEVAKAQFGEQDVSILALAEHILEQG